jgi:hypothetical protein
MTTGRAEALEIEVERKFDSVPGRGTMIRKPQSLGRWPAVFELRFPRREAISKVGEF